MKYTYHISCAVFFFFLIYINPVSARNYPDQHYIWFTDSMQNQIESSAGIIYNAESGCFQLADDQTYGYLILNSSESVEPFNRGLPSWNGTAPDENGGFLIQMRFPYNGGWSPWLTVGFWKTYIWNSYGPTSYAGGLIDYDYVKLNEYQNAWQFKIHMGRDKVEQQSPTLHKLSFFISDSRTTSSVDIDAIINDKPAEIFVDTEFFYQYALDDEIGGSICSPTSVSMVLRSLDIDVDPLQFAKDTYDPYYHIFGIWPRVVQLASEYARLDGAVTRYRSWSEAREVLANGGRVVMSVGLPLYEGHLIMLAGFNSNGDPISHDPARSNGYAYVHDKRKLSQSWFNKGGVAYTFYPVDNPAALVENENNMQERVISDFQLLQNFPNPFNPVTTIHYKLPNTNHIELSVYNLLGQQVARLVNKTQQAGIYEISWDAAELPSGNYFIVLRTETYQKIIRASLLK